MADLHSERIMERLETSLDFVAGTLVFLIFPLEKFIYIPKG